MTFLDPFTGFGLLLAWIACLGAIVGGLMALMWFGDYIKKRR